MADQNLDESQAAANLDGLKDWGLQTIFYAMNVRAAAKDAPLDDIKSLQAAKKKLEDTLMWLWKESLSEAGSDPNAFFLVFTKNVLDWTWHHRNPTPPKS
jgi:hypothetical protein